MRSLAPTLSSLVLDHCDGYLNFNDDSLAEVSLFASVDITIAINEISRPIASNILQLGTLLPALSHLSLRYTLRAEELRPLQVTKSSLAREASKAARREQSLVLIEATSALSAKIVSRGHVADVVSDDDDDAGVEDVAERARPW